jgi:hypothetical protein
MTASFIAGLSFADLVRLRQIVRKTHMKHYPTSKLTDHEADRIIESLGPRTNEALLKNFVDAQIVASTPIVGPINLKPWSPPK